MGQERDLWVWFFDKAVCLPSNEAVPACYSFNNESSGWIQLGVGHILESTDGNAPDYIKVAMYAAHEAVEHVNHMRGRELLIANSIISPEVHAQAPSEREANNTAKDVMRKRYNAEVVFGDEKFY